MTYLQEYLQRARAERREDQQSPEDLLRAMGNNLQSIVSLTDRNTEGADRNAKAVVGALGSATTEVRAVTEITKRASKEQIQVFVDYAEASRSSAKVSNQALIDINNQLKGIGTSLEKLVQAAQPKFTTDNTRAKERAVKFADREQMGGAGGSGSGRGPSLVDGILDSMFDFADDMPGRERGRSRGRGRNRGSARPRVRGGKGRFFRRALGAIGIGGGAVAAGEAVENSGSWWDTIKEKLAPGESSAAKGAAEGAESKGLKGLWNKLSPGVKSAKGFKVGGGLLTAALAAPEAYDILTSDDPNRDKVKEGGKLAGSTLGGVGGWSAGAAAGGMVGALGGPAAPVTVPLGMLIGGLGGAFAGSAAGEWVGDKAVDITRAISDGVSGIGSDIKKVYEDSIIPGFDKASKNVASFAESIGVSMSDFMTNFGKTVDELTQDFKEGANAGMAAASSVWSSLKERAGDVVDSGRKAVGDVVTGYKTGGIRGAADAVGTSAGNLVESAKRSARGFASDVANTKGLAAGRWTDDEYAAIQAAQASGEKFKGGQGLTQATKDKITAKALAAGIDPQALISMAQMESGGNTNAVSSTGAAGLFQFTGGTAKQYGVKNRFDEDQNIDAGIKLYQDNKAALEARGEKATPENIYLAHQQGAAGAISLLKASRGEGQISDAVAKNMSVNVGANAGGATDQEKAQKFIAANAQHLAAAGAKANNTTVAEGTYNQRGTQGPDVSVKTSPSYVPDKTTPNVSNAQLASSAPIVKSVQQEPQRKVSPAAEEEAKPVTVANAEQIAPTSVPEAAQTSTVVAGGGSSQVPSLDNTPMHIADFGLSLINNGVV